MRLFSLNRIEDEGGISGTGRVAEGVLFGNGWCVVVWLTKNTSCSVYASIDAVEAIHGHNGKTKIDFEQDDITGALSSLSETMEVARSKVIDDWAYAHLDNAHDKLKELLSSRPNNGLRRRDEELWLRLTSLNDGLVRIGKLLGVSTAISNVRDVEARIEHLLAENTKLKSDIAHG